MTTKKDFQSHLKESQGHGSSPLQLTIAKRLELKKAEDGQLCFCEYDKEKKENLFYPDPIEGVLIGEAMQMSAYSDYLGNRGGEYTSSFYFSKNDSIALFAPTPKGYEMVCKGDAATLEQYLTENATEKPKKRRVFFVLTTDGLYAIKTNLIMAIDQKKQVEKLLSTHTIKFTPALFEEQDPAIGKNAKKFLGKFRQKNPAKYLKLTPGRPLSDEMWDKIAGEKYADEFIAFKKAKTAASSSVEEESENDLDETQDKALAKGEKSAIYYGGTPTRSGKISPNANADAGITTNSVLDQGYQIPPERTNDLPF